MITKDFCVELYCKKKIYPVCVELTDKSMEDAKTDRILHVNTVGTVEICAWTHLINACEYL